MTLRYHLGLLPLLLAITLLAACITPPGQTATMSTPKAPASPTLAEPTATTTALMEQRVDDLLAQMTLAEKIGQMTQVEKNSIRRGDITTYFIGSILSGGGGYPTPNTGAAWAKMVDGFQQEALATRLAIPLIYGVDAIHGHNNVDGATIFPHSIGLGATRDADLVRRIGRATALEMAATGIPWNFAPVIAVPQDIRWGRTYEGYSENTEVVTALGTAFLQGLQNIDGQPALADPRTVLATPKHFIGDGGTAWGTSKASGGKLDQGNTQMDEATLRARFLPPYQTAIAAGAQSIMVSFSSWNGAKLHAHPYLLTEVLKGELGFQGFLISDWQAIDQIPGDYASDVTTAINAGLDMIMVPYDYRRFISTLTAAVERGAVPMSRIDDAVRRILRVKVMLGLFEHPYADPTFADQLGSAEHRALAREAVRKSLVLLKNADQSLPLAKETPLIFVAGLAADDIGIQSGGWTIEWQGRAGKITPGTTILAGIQTTVSADTRIEYSRSGNFTKVVDAQGQPLQADVGIAVVGERPYAEYEGDSSTLALTPADVTALQGLQAQSKKVIMVVIAGRPVIITEQLAQVDAVVVAWLPGSEGEGVADVLFGDYPFTGKLPYSWPRAVQQLPFDFANLPTTGCDAPLFPFDYGLTADETSPPLPTCP